MIMNLCKATSALELFLKLKLNIHNYIPIKEVLRLMLPAT